MFEASPRSKDVLAAEAALQWQFPGSAVAIPYDVFADDTFLQTFADFLEQSSGECFDEFAAHTKKAGTETVETRDPADPGLLSQMFMTLLEAYGRRVFPPVLRKRVRDDVCWDNGSEKPWRRCPYWLVLRVGLARYLITTHGADVGRAHYKLLLSMVLTRMLRSAIGAVDIGLLHNTRAKLARRLAKLEGDRRDCSSSVGEVYEKTLVALTPMIRSVLQSATDYINSTWDAYKRTTQRHVHVLPPRADSGSLHLSLTSSGAVLESILANPFPHDGGRHRQTSFEFNSGDASSRAFNEWYSALKNIEQEVEDGRFLQHLDQLHNENALLEISTAIEGYLDAVRDAYDGMPELESVKILTVMDMWMMLDERATGMMRLLLDYSPGIPPAALDVLQLPRWSDMCRLQKIQEHLHRRGETAGANAGTIFDDPSEQCFAVRYYSECDKSGKLAKLHHEIEQHAEAARHAKEQKWQKLSKEYESLSLQIAQTSCICGQAKRRETGNKLRCDKCDLKGKKAKMGLTIHEDLLPADPAQSKAVVFELRCPRGFSAYRSALWSILSRLGYPELVAPSEKAIPLNSSGKLSPFTRLLSGKVTLASMIKPFGKTHYKWARLPVKLAKVCVPQGMVFHYYDSGAKSWRCSQKMKPSFAHLCRWSVPPGSPLAHLHSSPSFSVDAKGPSSNEILASQTTCPSGLSVHEFMAFQTLFVGKHCRWPSILVELGSSALNFSSESNTTMIAQLAVHAGPAEPGDPLRKVHRIFRDEAFCKTLLSQIRQRLNLIAVNWRETNMMEMLLTLLLRLVSLASESARTKAMDLLELARDMTYQWMNQLRDEVRKASDCDVLQKLCGSMVWAAILCRRTFTPFTEGAASACSVEPGALQHFIEASTVLQDNMDSNPASFPSFLKLALVRDIRMRSRMGELVLRTIQHNPECLTAAVNNVWPQAVEDEGREFSKPEVIRLLSKEWVRLSVRWYKGARQQIIHYDPVHGHLFVDNKPLSRLPPEHRSSPILKELFGSQSLFVYPSHMPGMLYALNFAPGGHRIHLGTRGQRLIVRAHYRGAILELVPRDSLGSFDKPDLPASLVENCVHWIDVRTGVMEARQQPDIWIQKESNWLIDVRSRIARRRRSLLVDPCSSLFDNVARVLRGFEHPSRLTVYQPMSDKGKLSVELRRLDLNFIVNRKGLLYCKELQAEVDPDQDAGTWYGLNSGVVLRNNLNPQQRSILVPLGPLSWERNGIHVALSAENTGSYGIYPINTVLGRLDCPAEVRLLFFKALLHAFTSFIVPDPLTGRTGTEESLHCLQSGQYQPCMPLNPAFAQYLSALANLTPKRSYYPPGLKVMQHVLWDENLTTSIQNDELLPAVMKIYEKSLRLSTFSPKEAMVLLLEGSCDSHLRKRSSGRRSAFWRVDIGSPDYSSSLDMLYISRDRWMMNSKCRDVFESVSLIYSWRVGFPIRPNLAALLQEWPIFQGFGEASNTLLLSHLLTVDFAMEWGALANLCRRSQVRDRYKLCFVLGLVSFRHAINMDLVRTLIAFATVDKLKALESPTYPVYVQFEFNKIPSTEYLSRLIEPFYTSYSDGNVAENGTRYKLQKKLATALKMHQEQARAAARPLATFLAPQWPCACLTLEGFSGDGSLLLDISSAMEVVRTDWMRLLQNFKFSAYVALVQDVLDHLGPAQHIQMPERLVCDEVSTLQDRRGRDVPCLQDLLGRPCGSSEQEDGWISQKSLGVAEGSRVERRGVACEALERSTRTPEMCELKEILEMVAAADSGVRKQYGKDLGQSLLALETAHNLREQQGVQKSSGGTLDPVRHALEASSVHLDHINRALEYADARVAWLHQGGLWPCASPGALLKCLGTVAKVSFGKGMKDALIRYGLSVTRQQQLLRMDDARVRRNLKAVNEEAENFGHANWDPSEYPDWLLFEIESNLLIRPEQVDVALTTISPASGGNSVLQMNMGRGKTSCIIPMVAAVLADSKRLLRVIVPRALLVETTQILQARLGNLLGREVRNVPFSRRTPTSINTIDAYLDLHNEIMSSSGVIVALPENIMSFKLSGTQRLLDGRLQEATRMVDAQSWMEQVSRDVLDECDFTLAVRTQLIYPSGPQVDVDGHPVRWETSEALLKLVHGHLQDLQRDFPCSVEVVRRPNGGFPWVFFLRSDAEEALISRLVTDICRNETAILPLQGCSTADCEIVKRFISDLRVEATDQKRIDGVFVGRAALKKNVYLLRGLLTHGILLLTLKRRWNVQYGLHPMRDPIAVPYHAKGVPSDHAEWGHPDVAILFTCLSFYFQGLSVTQLQQCVRHVVQSDDPTSQYDRWVESADHLPCQLREWNIVNVDDEAQLRELWKHLRHTIVVIDYFLNHFVFPVHCKQFHVQVHTSGWDIPLHVPLAAGCEPQPDAAHMPLTTGFSGTNDNRTLLPLTIEQHDLRGLLHTNAEVLTYLLQQRNRRYVLVAEHGKRVSEEILLRKIKEQGIRTLIDAGAQVLEMDNLTLVKTWMRIDNEAKAALYFDADNKPFVLHRGGMQVPLLASSLAHNLRDCLVYLDEAHTRGTDLKLPSETTGALTLGLGQTKDQTVQGLTIC